MFSEFFRFDLRWHLRSPLMWLVGALFALMIFFATAFDFIRIGGAIGNVHRNAPITIINFLSVMDIFAIFLIAAIAGLPLLRDFDHGTDEIFFSSPVSRVSYVSGRWLAAVLAVVIVFCLMCTGAIFGNLVQRDPDQFGPFSWAPYVWSVLVVGLPNAIFMSALTALFAVLGRSLLRVYLGVIAFFVLFLIANILSTDVQYRDISALLDPFGINAIGNAVQYWSASERNTQLPPLSGMLLTNRALWLAVSFALFGIALTLFKPQRYRSGKAARHKKEIAHAAASAGASTSQVTLRFSAATVWQQFSEQWQFDTRGVLRGVAFVVLVAVGLANLLSGVFGAQRLYGTSIYPVTGLMLQAIQGSYQFLLVVIIGFYAGELVWRERDARIANVTDAMPTPDWIPTVAKFGALCAITAAFMLAGALECIVLQLIKGATPVQPLLYLQGLGIDSVGFFVLAAAALSLQIISNNRYVGYALFVLLIISQLAMRGFHLEHNLYTFNGTPQTPYSAMNGYGHFLLGWAWLQTYWTLFASALLCVATAFWVRGVPSRMAVRVRQAGAKLRGPLGAAVAVALVAFIACGCWIFYNTNVLNEYRASDKALDLRARYEKDYRKYKDLPQPRITDIQANVDIYPRERRVAIRGSYVLVNKNPAALTELHVLLDPRVKIRHLTMPPADLAVDDAEVGYRIYKLKEPLAPGASVRFEFDVERHDRGFTNDGTVAGAGASMPITYNGTFFNNSNYMPQFGYDESQQIVDRSERRKRGLGDVPRMPKLEDQAARMTTGFGDADWVNLDTTVSTSADQIALAPGYLQKDWTENGRHYFHYKTDAPILPFFCYLSARWQVKRGEWHGLPIEVYYDPQHEYNVQRMIYATQKALDYYTKNFSPYQFRQVRILEFPGYSQFAQSFANTIPFSESIGFIADLRDPKDIDYVFYVTAHEVAHQWWAHQVIGGNVQGQNMLAESMSQYSALMVMEKEYGPAKMRKFLKYELDRYLRGRGGELIEELPLMRVENQPYIHYAKGSLVFYRLKEEIGEDNLNRALAKFVHDKAFQQPPYTTTLEFMDYIREVTPLDKQQLLTDLFEKIVFYDNRVTDATAIKRADGKYDVTIRYSAAKKQADGRGAETDLPVDDWLDVGVFSTKKDPDGEYEPLTIERQHITQKEGTITLTVDQPPGDAGIDPYNKLIDRVPDDNRRAVTIK